VTAMDELEPYIARLGRRRRGGAAQPVVATPEEARALASRLAGEIAGLSDDQKLLLFSNLADLHEALKARIRHLDDEMSADRERLQAMGRNLRACGLYDAAGRAAPPPRGRR